MERHSRERYNMTSMRPRPVTATVTKPSWMLPEAIVGPRSHSVESRGSTASLTSVLDHDSCDSFTDDEVEPELQNLDKENVDERPLKTADPNIKRNTDKTTKKVIKKKVIRKFVESPQTDDTDENELNMSPWEQWLIQKVKDDRQKRKDERMKKKEEKTKKEEEEIIKQQKLQKAEQTRKEWEEKKNFEEKLKKRLDKQRAKTEKMIREEEKKMVSVKADRKFQEWMDNKQMDEQEKKRKEKRTEQEEKMLQKQQRVKAQQTFEEWCRKADQRSRPLPNSFGYTSGKLTGYHDTNAYPVPTFYNPMPWQPIHIPRPASEKARSRKSKPKPKYVWNPEKYR